MAASTAKIRHSSRHSLPQVHLTHEAYADMHAITCATDDEVGWFFEVEMGEDGEFIGTRVFLPEQECHGATTEMQPEALAAFGLQHLEAEGHEAYNKLRGWGHSHPKMGLSPSGQDQNMIDDLCDQTGEPFVAVRMNQSGEVEADVAFPHGTTYERLMVYLGMPDYERNDRWYRLVKERVKRLAVKVTGKKNTAIVTAKGTQQGGGQGKASADREISRPQSFEWEKDWPTQGGRDLSEVFINAHGQYGRNDPDPLEDPMVYDYRTYRYVPLSEALEPNLKDIPEGWLQSWQAKHWVAQHEQILGAYHHDLTNALFSAGLLDDYLDAEFGEEEDDDTPCSDSTLESGKHEWIEAADANQNLILFCANCRTEVGGYKAEKILAGLVADMERAQREANASDKARKEALDS